MTSLCSYAVIFYQSKATSKLDICFFILIIFICQASKIFDTAYQKGYNKAERKPEKELRIPNKCGRNEGK